MKQRLLKASSMEVAQAFLNLLRVHAPGYWKRSWANRTIIIEVY